MKNFHKLTTLLAITICLTAHANLTCTVDRQDALWDPQTSLGQYRINPDPNLLAELIDTGPFLTFSVEKYESIDDSGNTTYNVLLLEEALYGNGRWPDEPAGPYGGDLLSPQTAYLYSAFRTGLIPITTTAHAIDMQNAIWYLENELGEIPTESLSHQTQQWINLAQTNAPQTIQNVRVLNTGVYSGKDMLAIIIPEPNTAITLATATAILITIKRK